MSSTSSDASSDDRSSGHEQDVVVRALSRLPAEARRPVLVVGVIVALAIILTAGVRVGEVVADHGWRGAAVLGATGLLVVAVVAIGVTFDRRSSGS